MLACDLLIQTSMRHGNDILASQKHICCYIVGLANGVSLASGKMKETVANIIVLTLQILDLTSGCDVGMVCGASPMR